MKISCDSRLSENTTGLICDSLESSVTDINQRICPTVSQTCANVSSEESPFAVNNRTVLSADTAAEFH